MTAASRHDDLRAPRVRRAGGRRTVGSPPGEPRRVAYLYLAPGFLLVLAFVIVPLLHTVYFSFFQWDGVTPATPVGLGNYVQILQDPALWSLFVHSSVLVIFYAVIPIGLGLLITAMFARSTVRGMTFYRSVLFLPQAISLVVVAIAWQWMYAQTGVANQFLALFGLDQHIAWLGSFTWALPAIGIVGSWLLTGLCMVLFLSGVQKIDASLYEAARLDGANSWHEFISVTLPGLRAELTVALTLTVVAALRSFDLVYLMTQGGPGSSTSVPGYVIFQDAFSNQRVGLAASLAVVLTVIILIVTTFINRLSRSSE
ncbi:carbohydrate ABC transporter permease [Leifsonia sp. TF02-11]|uniref:carbohydrate ABC transporter permease n=1 Tax=Leifsonia sp. TF02-11 TaxID=2815212 RepID=UPI001AA0E462|nr:sugar ABC transporter permease [Leifsonia sp. TF02-11]MBO1740617.1 sugar ABC transporter permease [Leifsonia sp. TF02-11]